MPVVVKLVKLAPALAGATGLIGWQVTGVFLQRQVQKPVSRTIVMQSLLAR